MPDELPRASGPYYLLLFTAAGRQEKGGPFLHGEVGSQEAQDPSCELRLRERAFPPAGSVRCADACGCHRQEGADADLEQHTAQPCGLRAGLGRQAGHLLGRCEALPTVQAGFLADEEGEDEHELLPQGLRDPSYAHGRDPRVGSAGDAPLRGCQEEGAEAA